MTDLASSFHSITQLAKIGQNYPTLANVRRIRRKCDDLLAAAEMTERASNGFTIEESVGKVQTDLAWLNSNVPNLIRALCIIAVGKVPNPTIIARNALDDAGISLIYPDEGKVK